MGKLLVSQRFNASQTLVSNEFIDLFMPYCNELQLKVYLHVLRSAQAGEPTGIAEIADFCNDTEREVLRALKYWERLNVLGLDYSEGEDPVGVRVNPIQEARLPMALSRLSEEVSEPLQPAPIPQESSGSFEKHPYSPEEVNRFSTDEKFSQLLFVAEQYQGRPLTDREVETLLFLYDVCALPQELIAYLMEYCIDRGKKDFRYIEAVGISWAKNGITTREEALQFSGKYDKLFYEVMRALGRSSDPTQVEAEFITRWTKTWGFPRELVLEACRRTVLAADSHRFEYCNKILEAWKDSGIRNLSELELSEKKWREKKAGSTARAKYSANPFNRYPQTTYDFSILEQLISNH